MLVAALTLLTAPADLQYRWVYLQTNFFRPEAVEQALKLVDRMGKAGYNGLAFTDTKLSTQNPFPDFYRKHVQNLLERAKQNGVEVIPFVLPVGWADGMLSHDPSLVESMPCRDVTYVARKANLVLEQDPSTVFQNGNFETGDGDKLKGFAFQDGIGSVSFIDKQVKHDGTSSLRIENPGNLKETSGNCRVMQRVPVKPWHQYRFSAWMKTDGFDRASSVREMVLAPSGKPLSHGELGLPQTQDWTKYSVVFNSQDNSEALVYLGVWGGNKGKLWFDEAGIEDVGLLNVTRRPGCPLTIKSTTGVTYKERQDIEPISDPKFGNIPWSGAFDFKHETPTVKLSDTSRIREGERVMLSYYAAVGTDHDQYKTAICPSEPKTLDIMRGEIDRVRELFGAKSLFFAHDEIRVMNWCEACQSRKLTPGEIIASNIAAASKMAPGTTQFVWSDMFDPHHNAVKDYYLVNGTLEGSWNGLNPKMVIVNWNSGEADESLAFFAGRGHKQILAGYYDNSVDQIKGWMEKARVTNSLSGVMYTTWADDYSQLEAFAKAAWGGKP